MQVHMFCAILYQYQHVQAHQLVSKCTNGLERSRLALNGKQATRSYLEGKSGIVSNLTKEGKRTPTFHPFLPKTTMITMSGSDFGML